MSVLISMVDFSPDVLAWKQLLLPKFGAELKIICVHFQNFLTPCTHAIINYVHIFHGSTSSTSYSWKMVIYDRQIAASWGQVTNLRLSRVCIIKVSFSLIYNGITHFHPNRKSRTEQLHFQEQILCIRAHCSLISVASQALSSWSQCLLIVTATVPCSPVQWFRPTSYRNEVGLWQPSESEYATVQWELGWPIRFHLGARSDSPQQNVPYTEPIKHQSSASLAFVRGIQRWPVNSPHKLPVTRKMFPFDGVIMISGSVWARNGEHVTILTSLFFFWIKLAFPERWYYYHPIHDCNTLERGKQVNSTGLLVTT